MSKKEETKSLAERMAMESMSISGHKNSASKNGGNSNESRTAKSTDDK